MVRTGPRLPSASRGGETVRRLDGADVLRLQALLALRDVELDVLPLVEALVALNLDGGEVDEHVRTSVGRRDEAEALFAVEPLHGALSHVSTFLARSPLPSTDLAARGVFL